MKSLVLIFASLISFNSFAALWSSPTVLIQCKGDSDLTIQMEKSVLADRRVNAYRIIFQGKNPNDHFEFLTDPLHRDAKQMFLDRLFIDGSYHNGARAVGLAVKSIEYTDEWARERDMFFKADVVIDLELDVSDDANTGTIRAYRLDHSKGDRRGQQVIDASLFNCVTVL